MTSSFCRLPFMTRKYSTALLCILAAACSESGESSADSTKTNPPQPVAILQRVDQTTDTGHAKAGCPHTGLWAICSVENRVRQSGFVAKRVEGEAPKRLGFSVTPVVYTLGKSRLEVFIYPDEAALARDFANIDTVEVAPEGATGSWDTRPVLIRSGNLAAVLLSQNPRQAERLSLALTAGAPQPGSPR
jgi:hypothetical protein